MAGDVFAQAPFGGGIALAALFGLIALGPAVFTLAVGISLYDLLVVAFTPWSDIGDVSEARDGGDADDGRRKFRGRVACEEQITEPLSGRDVVAFETTVETAVSESWPEPRNWRQAETIDAGTTFDLTDDTGSVRVDPVDHFDEAALGRPALGERVEFGDSDVDAADSREFGPDERPPREFMSLLSELSDIDPATPIRTTTRTIEPGDEVVVLGDVHTTDGAATISNDDSSVFYLLVDDYRTTLRRGIVRNGGLTFAGAAVTLALVATAVVSL